MMQHSGNAEAQDFFSRGLSLGKHKLKVQLQKEVLAGLNAKLGPYVLAW